MIPPRVLLLDPGRVVPDVPKRTAFIREALDKIGAKTVLFTQAGVLEYSPELGTWFEQVAEFPDFRTNCDVELLAAKMHGERPFTHILAYREVDIIRASRMRKALKIEGQDEQSAMIFRDKLLMKDTAQAAHLAVLPYSAVRSVWDLLDFSKQHGFPLIVKPRLEYGMIGLALIRDLSDLETKAKQLFRQNSEYPQFYIAETYCSAKMAHVDGIWKNGRMLCACASVYTGPGPLDDRMPEEHEPSGSVMLAAQDQLSGRLCALTENTLRAFPTPEVTAFHAEVWVRENGTLVLNEIACRPAGMYIYDMLSEVFGIPLETALTMELFGHNSGIPFSPLKLAENFRVPVRPGKVLKIPPKCDLPGVSYYYPAFAQGDVVPPPRAWYDCMATFITTAGSAMELKERRQKTSEWFWRETIISKD